MIGEEPENADDVVVRDRNVVVGQWTAHKP